MTTVSDTPDVVKILQLSASHGTSKVMQSAAELGVFALLSGGALTEPELRERLGIHARPSREFLDILVALGMLERHGGRYRNSAAAENHLVPGRAGYVGAFLQVAPRLYDEWSDLTALLRKGTKGQDPEELFGDQPKDPAILRHFMECMDAINSTIAPHIAQGLDWSRYQSFVDVGGARGNVAAAVIDAHPHLRGTVFDVRSTEPLFSEHVTRLGKAEQIGFVGGSFFTDPLPRGDVLIFGHVLHDWSPEQRQDLLAKAYEAVSPGGAVAVYDRMIDDERTDLTNLLVSLNMIIMTPAGSEYTIGECRHWAESAGFVFDSARPLPSFDVLVVASKPA
ncbi:methyltransferase [Amycolatopsis vastitatis]|uniref:Methyltransferase n=1 Tax=Amycolatopsis vastitatis TaxID=1905142 RepID=A0A229TFR8_9PSEU|nr:methyltransferase [Amycolatopsis vastitatis]OXM69791.1 hypothetical protein CF165_09845 [Amycolatopsis vastitatis]